MLRRILVALVLVKIAGIVIVFTWAGQLGFDLPKALWSRALEWPIAATLVLTGYRYGVAVVPRTRLHVLVAVFVLANIVSAVTAQNTYIAVYGEWNRYLGLTNVVDMALLYLATVVAFRTIRDWALLAAGVAAATIVAIAYGVIQYSGHDPITWGVDPRIRPFGTIGNPDMYGHLLATVVAASVAIALTARPLVARRGAAAMAVLALAMLAITGTRGSLVALIAALAGGGAVAVATRGRAFLRSRLVAGGATAAVLVGAVLLATPTGQRLLGAAPTADRLLEWDGSFHAFLARPIFGWGPDNLGVGFPSVRPEHMEGPFPSHGLVIDQAHDWILQALATTGIVGAASLVALVGASAAVLFRRRRTSLSFVAWPLALAALAYWTNGITSPDSVSIGWIPWLIFAASAWLVGRAPTTMPALRPLPGAVGAGVLILSLAGSVTGWNAIRANAEIFRAAVAYPRDADATVSGANAAIALDPGRGDYWNYRGLGFQLRGQYALAAADFTEATTRTPYQFAYGINLARSRLFQVQNGDFTGGGEASALAAAKRSVDLDPRISEPHRNYSEIAYALGDFTLALAEARVAFDLYSPEPLTQQALAKAAVKSPDPELARRALEAAVAKESSASLWAALAQVHLASGNAGAARAAALRALTLDPNSADARAVLAATGP